MNDDAVSRIQFWTYDIFAYFLPGFFVLAVATKANVSAHDLLLERWAVKDFMGVVVLIALAYILGHVIAALSSWILERLLLRHMLGYPTDRMVPGRTGAVRLWLHRVWERVPPKFREVAYSFRAILFPGYFRPYSRNFQAVLKQRFEARFDFAPGDNHDIFWLAFSFVSLHHPTSFRRATHFLSLYGFSRNVSMAFLLLAPLPLLPGWARPIPGYLWAPMALVFAFLMYSNYAKLLRRLNDEVYRAFVAVSAPPPGDGRKSADLRKPVDGLLADAERLEEDPEDGSL